MPEPHHTIQERDEFPKGVGNVQNNDLVQIVMQQSMARAFDTFLKAQNLHLAGPMIFSEDDIPTYIIGIGRI